MSDAYTDACKDTLTSSSTSTVRIKPHKTIDYREAAEAIMDAIDPTGSIEKKIEELDARASALESKALLAEISIRQELVHSIQDTLKIINEKGGNAFKDLEKASQGLDSMSVGEMARAAVIRGAQVGAATVIAYFAEINKDLFTAYADWTLIGRHLEEALKVYHLEGKVDSEGLLDHELPF